MTEYTVKVRKAILSQTTPFCITDLICRLNQKGLKNTGIILNALDELFDAGIVKYDKVATHLDGREIYAFYVE